LEKKKIKFSKKTNGGFRQRSLVKYQVSAGEKFDYKNIALIQKFLNDRGKIVPRRISGISAKEQRELGLAVKRARILALLTTGGIKK